LLLVQIPGLLPLAFAGLAWLDGEHRVQLGTGEKGYQLVLRHDANAAPDSAYFYQHQHCVVGRMLVALASTKPDASQDHVLSFRNATNSENLAQLSFLAGSSEVSPRPPVWLLVSQQFPDLALISHQFPGSSYSRPPPATATTAFVRQTVLLI